MAHPINDLLKQGIIIMDDVEYQKYEFCKDVKCPGLKTKCTESPTDCYFTAKEFHQWLKTNWFSIVKDCQHKNFTIEKYPIGCGFIAYCPDCELIGEYGNTEEEARSNFEENWIKEK